MDVHILVRWEDRGDGYGIVRVYASRVECEAEVEKRGGYPYQMTVWWITPARAGEEGATSAADPQKP